MSLTRANIKEILSKAGMPAEGISAAVDGILEGHTASIDYLTEQRDKYKADAESLPAVTKERDDWKKKHDDVLAKQPDAAKVQADFDAYKKDVETKATNAKKSDALWAKLLAEGANPDAKELLLHGVDFEAVKLDEKGEADVSKAVEPIKTTYAKYFGAVVENGAPRKNPPPGQASPEKDKMSDEEWFAAKQAAKAKP